MANVTLEEAVKELNSPQSNQTKLAALELIKNSIIGHPGTKYQLVQHGLIQGLNNALKVIEKSRGKRKEDYKNFQHGSADGSPTDWDEEIRLQCIIVLGSLARGHTAYVADESTFFAVLYNALSPKLNGPKTVLASLRTLLAMVQAIQRMPYENLSRNLEELFERPQYIQAMYDILSQEKSYSATVQNQVMLLCHFLDLAVLTEHQRAIIAESGIVERIGAHLAAYYVYHKSRNSRNGLSISGLVSPPSARSLPYLLAALSALIGASHYRTARLLAYPAIATVFPFQVPATSVERHHQTLSDISLPWVHPGAQKQDTFSKAFPTLGSAPPPMHSSALLDFADNVQFVPESSQVTAESSMISWLLYCIRTEKSSARIQAARLLTTIIESGFSERSRDRILALLVVPVLASFLDEAQSSQEKKINSATLADKLEADEIRIQATHVLAKLIGLCPSLQKSAIDAEAVKKVCSMFKRTQDPVKIAGRGAFLQLQDAGIEDCNLHAVVTETLKSRAIALPVEVQNIFRLREAALLLMAAIADKEDKYRKLLTEQSAITFIIDALEVLTESKLGNFWTEIEQPKRHSDPIDMVRSFGNPKQVIIAACSAAKAMSRSVSLLRTSLIDAGLGKPCIELLEYTDASILAAALDVVTNIITEVSPIRPDLLKEGVVKTLCKHAHSSDPAIRLRALWALKHLLYRSPDDIKTECFHELGSNWLLEIITDSIPNTTSTFKSQNGYSNVSTAANAAGEKIDILNTTSSVATSTGAEPMDTSDSTEPPQPQQLPAADTHQYYPSYDSLYRPILSNLHDISLRAPSRQAQADALQIQVQGLDFIRNLIQGRNTAAMIDLLFSEIPASRVFEILISKLSPRAPPPPPSASSNTPSPSLADAYNPTPLLTSALYIFVHLAASHLPAHRSLLTTHPTLLSSTLLPLTHHPHADVRVATVWIFVNLSWVHDVSDAAGVEARIRRLVECGVLRRLREMAGEDEGGSKGDESLDVRERAGVAAKQCEGKRGTGAGASAGGGAAPGAAGLGQGAGAGLSSLGLQGGLGLGRAR